MVSASEERFELCRRRAEVYQGLEKYNPFIWQNVAVVVHPGMPLVQLKCFVMSVIYSLSR